MFICTAMQCKLNNTLRSWHWPSIQIPHASSGQVQFWVATMFNSSYARRPDRLYAYYCWSHFNFSNTCREGIKLSFIRLYCIRRDTNLNRKRMRLITIWINDGFVTFVVRQLYNLSSNLLTVWVFIRFDWGRHLTFIWFLLYIT